MTEYLKSFEINQIDFRGEGAFGLNWGYAKTNDEVRTNELLSQKMHPSGLSLIEPADTWNQPRVLTNEQKELFEKIALESYLKVLHNGQFDPNSDVFYSKEFTKSLRSIESLPEELQNNLRSKCFAEIKRFHFYFGEHEKKLLLRDARILMKMIGPSLEEIVIDGHIYKKWPHNICRYLYKINQLTGENIRSLILKNVEANQSWEKPLRSILNKIKAIDIKSDNYDFDDYDLDLPVLCPQLESLKIKMNMKGEKIVKTWPTLVKFVNKNNQYMTEQLQWQFLKLNPQIRYLKIDACDTINLTKKIVDHVPKLETLCLTDNYPGFTSENLSPLLELRSLTKLELKNISEENTDDILKLLTKFVNLKALKVYFFEEEFTEDEDKTWNSDLVVEIAKSLHRLEEFHLHYFLLTENAFLELIKNAKKLKIFDIRGCGLPVTSELLNKIHEIRDLIKLHFGLKLIFFENEMKVNAENVSTYSCTKYLLRCYPRLFIFLLG